MPVINVRVSGLEGLDIDVGAITLAAIAKVAPRVLADAQAVWRRQPWPRRTGRLRRSLRLTLQGTQTAVVWNAHYEWYGRFQPSFAANRRALETWFNTVGTAILIEQITADVNQAIQEGIGG